MFFLHKNHLTQKNLYAQTAHRSFYRLLQTDFRARRNFTQQNFFRTEAFTHKQNYAQQFLQTDGFYTQKVLRTEGFTVYTQHFLHTDAFTHRCLYTVTDTNCTQKLVHTARVYTRPIFTQRGFVSPSWSPTFRVPPLKHNLGDNGDIIGMLYDWEHGTWWFKWYGHLSNKQWWFTVILVGGLEHFFPQ